MRLGDPDPDVMEVAAPSTPRRRRESDSPGRAESSSESGECEVVKATRRRKRRALPRKPEGPPGMQSSASGSGLPPSGVVCRNRFAALGVEGMDSSQAGEGARVGEGSAPEPLLMETSASEDRCFTPPSSPNASSFLCLEEGSAGFGTGEGK